jgi:hypothetical protein
VCVCVCVCVCVQVRERARVCVLFFFVNYVVTGVTGKCFTPTAKHIRGGWSHYTDTSKPVDGNGAQNMFTVQSGFRTRHLSIAGSTCANGPGCFVDTKNYVGSGR